MRVGASIRWGMSRIPPRWHGNRGLGRLGGGGGGGGQVALLIRDKRVYAPGAKTLGTDGSVHAAPASPGLPLRTGGALGRSRQSPRFRAVSPGRGAKTSGTDGSVHAAPASPGLPLRTVGALGRSRQSPRFRAVSPGRGAKTSGTDGSVYAAPASPGLPLGTGGALGRSRQSPRFRAVSPGRGAKTLGTDGSVHAAPASPGLPLGRWAPWDGVVSPRVFALSRQASSAGAKSDLPSPFARLYTDISLVCL